MNRLTKQICLVLISSSLVLHGCHRSLTDEEKKKEEEQAGAAAGTGTGSTYGYHSGYHPGFYHGYYGGPLFHSGTTGAGTPHISGGSGSRGSASGTSASVHGGFGGSAHGVGS